MKWLPMKKYIKGADPFLIRYRIGDGQYVYALGRYSERSHSPRANYSCMDRSMGYYTEGENAELVWNFYPDDRLEYMEIPK